MSILQRKLSQNATCISRIGGLDVPKFCGGNFHRGLSNHNICEGFLPRAFPTVWYKLEKCDLVLFLILPHFFEY